ncbi:hypothetical protein [Streptomyces sp. LPB2020-019-1HS]|uniref:hypothetical protein n=1 Tax=Streptomyces sp. LPB2020-019-1HS TaxID=3409689 RepID=UPI003B685789
MGEQPKKHQPQLVRTDFESKTHEQLVAMLESASSAGAQSLHQKLAKAASTITKIGDDLMQYVKDLEWQGDGGDAFRDWAAQTASATLNLGEYALISSRCMQVVSQAIAEAKSAMPDTSETQQARADLKKAHETIAATTTSSARHDPDARKLTQTAESNAEEAEYRIEKIRHEAIQQLRKLAQTYEATGQQVNSMSPPTFSPPSQHLDSNQWVDRGQHVPAGAVGASAANAGHAWHAVGQQSDSVSVPGSAAPVPETVGSHDRLPPTAQLGVHSRPVALGLDAVDTPSRTTPPTQAEPHPQQISPVRSETPALGQPPTVPNPLRNGGQMPTLRMPSLSQLPTPSSPEGPATERSPRSPRESGILGGRPVSTGSGQAYNSIGRGTVIGSSNTQGRTGIPRPLQAHGPSAGSSSATKGLPSAKRMAFEPGPNTGGRQPQSRRGAGRPFTAGGSGLVRASSNAAEQSQGQVTGRTQVGKAVTQRPDSHEKREQPSQRPSYLVEDEETWVHDSRRPLPPVVG